MISPPDPHHAPVSISLAIGMPGWDLLYLFTSDLFYFILFIYFFFFSVENFAYRVCGGDITSPSGWLAASNTEVDECNWALHAPEGYIIEVNVTFLYTNIASQCYSSYLWVSQIKLSFLYLYALSVLLLAQTKC